MMLQGIGNYTEEEWYSRLSPSSCYHLKMISYYCILIFTASLAVNGILMMVFFKNKELRTPVNMFVIWFTGLSFLASLTEPVFVVASNFNCRYYLNLINLTLNLRSIRWERDLWFIIKKSLFHTFRSKTWTSTVSKCDFI